VGRFFIGAAWGLAAISLLIGTLLALHLVSFDAQLDHGWAILEYGGAQLLLFLFVGLVEEYLFRGYLQFTLTRGLVGVGKLISPTHARTIAFWIATVITSGLFFLAHTGNSGEDMVGLVLVFAAGVVFVVALWRTGSLWWAIGFHMAWDWAQSFLYGVPTAACCCRGGCLPHMRMATRCSPAERTAPREVSYASHHAAGDCGAVVYTVFSAAGAGDKRACRKGRVGRDCGC